MPVFIICISWSLLRVHVVSSLLNIGKNLINLQFFREIFAVCVQTFGSSDRANSCSGTLPLNFVIEFVTSRLEAGHYTGSNKRNCKIFGQSQWSMQCMYELNCYLNTYKALGSCLHQLQELAVCLFWQMKVVKLEQMHHSPRLCRRGNEVKRSELARFAWAVARSAWAQLFTHECHRESVSNTGRPSLHKTQAAGKKPVETFIAAKV